MFSFDIIIKSFGKQHAVCNMDGTFTKCTRCIQSINVESRLILISVKNGVTMQNSFLVLRVFPDVSHFEISILFVFSTFRGMSVSDP